MLLEGIGPKSSAKIIAHFQEHDNPFAYLAQYPKKAKYQLDLHRLGAVLEQLRPLTPAEQLPILLEYYTPILRNRYDDHPKRECDLEQLQTITERFDDLEAFLSEMTLEPPNRSVNDVLETDDDDECLTLSTIHSAKGLEWHSVFVIWLLDGRFPSMYAAYSNPKLFVTSHTNQTSLT